MNSRADQMRDRVRELRTSAVESNLERCSQLEAAMNQAVTAGLDPEGRRDAADVAHKLLGSAGTFGFPIASDRAGRLERLLLGDGPVDAAQASGWLVEIREALSGDPEDDHSW